MVVVRKQGERIRLEMSSAPRAVLQGNRSRIASRVRLELASLDTGGVRPPVAFLPHAVGGCGLAHPKTDLERPVSVTGGVLPAFQLQSADKSSGTRKLVQGEEAERVAHDDAHTGSTKTVRSRIAQAPKHYRYCGQAQVGFCLAAARREEEQVDDLAVRFLRIGEAGYVQQDECELEGVPARRVLVEPLWESLAHSTGNGAIRHAEGIEHVCVVNKGLDSALDTLGCEFGESKQLLRGLASRPGRLSQIGSRGVDPVAVVLR